MRDAHYHDLIQIYYDTVANTIKILGSDPEKCFTFNDLQDQFQKFGKFGVQSAILLLQVICAEAKDIPDFDELSEKMAGNTLAQEDFFPNNGNSVYSSRIADVVRDIIGYGYF